MSTKSSTNRQQQQHQKHSSNQQSSPDKDNQQQAQLKHIASVVCALLKSRKPPCLLQEILREYPDVENKSLPYCNLGYKSAKELLEKTGQFTFNEISGETCIALKYSSRAASNTAHTATRGQKSNKAVIPAQPKKPVTTRQPRRTDQSWNKSSYSTNVYQKLPAATTNRQGTVAQRTTNGEASRRNNRNKRIDGEVERKNHVAKSSEAKNSDPKNSELKKAQGGDRNNNNMFQRKYQPPMAAQEDDTRDLRDTLNWRQSAAQPPAQTAPRAILGSNYKMPSERLTQQPCQAGQQGQRRIQPLMQLNIQPPNQATNQPPTQPTAQPTVPNFQSSNGGFSKKSNLQDRLSLRIQNSNSNQSSYQQCGEHSSGVTPLTSPGTSSAGSEYQPQPDFERRFNDLEQRAQTQPLYPVRVFQFNHRLDPITSIKQYCTVRCFPAPEFITIRSKFSRLFQCRVNINDKIYSTYPNEFPTEVLAKLNCAQGAIQSIIELENQRPLPPSNDSDEELVEKLYAELLAHPTGIFAKKIPEVFRNNFQRTLPDHWWSLVQQSNKFITESTEPSKAIIVFANENPESDETISAEPAVIQMDGIKLPWHDKYWDLYITHCASTVELWARLFGSEFSDRFDLLLKDIDAHMKTAMNRPLAIACKQIYLIYLSDSWHRVRVEEMNKQTASALCFFIDFGDTDWQPVNKLYYCEPKFLKLPAQAVALSLFGLEDFAEYANARRHLDEVLASKSLVGEILTKESEFFATDSAASGKIRVVLYDTSTEEDVNLNAALVDKISDDMTPPQIKSNKPTCVNVTHVSDDGHVFLQILNSDFKYMKKLLQQLIESKFKQQQHKISDDELKSSNILLVCDEKADAEPNWYRGILNAPLRSGDQEVSIFCVDHGKIQRTHVSKIYSLESLSMALSKIPHQAIKAKLHKINDITKHVVGRMRALLPDNSEALVKLVTAAQVPLITIYRRLEGSDTLSNINDVIHIELELEKCSIEPENTNGSAALQSGNITPTTPANAFVDMTRGLVITSVPNTPQKSGGLQKLKDYDKIPALDYYFEVRVVLSSNPSNFVIQPYEDYRCLRDLMKDLQEYCETNDDFIPADMVEIGQAYAAKNADGFYHRVTVVSIINGEMIHVCYCDFGDITVLRSDQLKILPAKFRQLPKMAIHAKLYGIAARDKVWTIEDCERFRKLTMGQKFVATVKRFSYEASNKTPTQILEVELIDVTTDEDVYIHQVLLQEGRAVQQE